MDGLMNTYTVHVGLLILFPIAGGKSFQLSIFNIRFWMKTNILRWTVQIHETTSKFLNGNHQDKADAYNAIVRLKKEPHPSSMNAQLVGAEKHLRKLWIEHLSKQ